VPEDERRCPSCNALAAPDAEWCGQCYASLRTEPEPPPIPAPPVPGAVPPVASSTDATSEAGWPCQVCGASNPMASDVCVACGSPFAASMRAGEDRPEVSPRDAVMWSLVFPGLGHRLAGRAMDGLARGVLFAMSIGMVALLLMASSTAATTAVVLLFLTSAIVVYVLSAMEASRLANGGDVIVGSRLLMWILVGMTFASVGALALSILGATPG
jgi:hypothetical protein